VTRLADVSCIVVRRAVIEHIQAHLRRVGDDGHEGLGLWAGRQEGVRFNVDQAIIPAQRHIRTSDGVCVTIGPDELHRLNVWLFEKKLRLIAQIHSHPGRAYHSDTDDAYAVATTVGCISIVVPDFARRSFDLNRVATYRLAADGLWEELPAAQVRRLIVLTE
jgi:hypothetical protein